MAPNSTNANGEKMCLMLKKIIKLISAPPHDQVILVVGGQGLSGPLHSVEVYDIAAKGSSLAMNVYPEQVTHVFTV